MQRRLPGSQVMVAEALQHEAHPDPSTDDFVLQVFRDGPLVDAWVDLGAGRFQFPGIPGAFAVSPPGLDCDYKSVRVERPFRLMMIGMPRVLLDQVRQELRLASSTDLGPLHAGPLFDPGVQFLAYRLQHEAEDGFPRGSLYADHVVTSIIRSLLRRSGSLSAFPTPARRLGPARLRTLVDFMRANLGVPLQLEDLAQAVGMPRFDLSRAFKATMGVSPWQYFLALRCEHAAELIVRHGDAASLAFLAHECGFHDQSHFNRHFKRYIGYPPGKLRRQLGGRRRTAD